MYGLPCRLSSCQILKRWGISPTKSSITVSFFLDSFLHNKIAWFIGWPMVLNRELWGMFRKCSSKPSRLLMGGQALEKSISNNKSSVLPSSQSVSGIALTHAGLHSGDSHSHPRNTGSVGVRASECRPSPELAWGHTARKQTQLV